MSNLKRVLVLTLVLMLSVGGDAFAKSGSAVTPYVKSRYTSSSSYAHFHVYVSNITSSSINVSVTFYDESGTIVTDGDDSPSTGSIRNDTGTVTNWDDAPTSSSVSFTLGGNETTAIHFRPSSLTSGYAIIEWSQDGDNVVGLVASILREHYGDGFSVEPINNGLPF